FVPPALIGESATRLFPTGNVVGRVGGVISQVAWSLFGVTALLIPILPAVWAAGVLERIRASSSTRLSILLAGTLVLVPTGIYTFAWPAEYVPASAGWIGVTLGAPLTSGLGWIGAGLLLVFLQVALCVGTIRWNPLRSVGRGGARALAGSKQAADAVSGTLSRFSFPQSVRRGAWRRLPAGVGDVGSLAADAGGLPTPTIAGVEPAAEPVQPVAVPRPRAAKRAAEPHPAPLPDSGAPTSPDLPSTTLLSPA